MRDCIRTPLVAPDPDALPFDCIAEVWCEEMEAFKSLAQLATSVRGKVIFDIAGTSADTRNMVAMLVRETDS